MYVIRAAEPSDVSLLVGMRMELFAEMTGVHEEPNGQRVYEERLLSLEMDAGRYVAWIAEDAAGNAAACASLTLYKLPPKPWNLSGQHAYLSGVYTRPGHRRLGLATRLVAQATEHCRAMGVPDMTLHATEDGEKLYETLGFEGTNEMRRIIERSMPEQMTSPTDNADAFITA